MLPPKADVIDAFRRTISEELAAVESVAAMARDEVSNDETRSEGKYDTRATEASYLARGQAERIVALRRLLSWFETIDPARFATDVVKIGALVRLSGDRPSVVFVAPAGGPRVTVGGTVVQAISMTSPLGEVLEDLEVEDELELDTPRGVQDLTVAEIA